MICTPVLSATIRTFVISAALCFSPLAFADSANLNQRLERYRDALASDLPAPAQSALLRIDGTARQLLALRAYVRAGDRLLDRWSWSEDQIESFEKTAAYSEVMAEVARVQTRFEAENPGYTLYANTDVRSLDTQIERWNTNASVQRAARAIQRAVSKELLKSHYSDPPSAAAIDRFHAFLQRWRPPSAPTLAAPGLSLHGQLRAIDFAVYKDGKVVAPTTLTLADEAWERDGWSAKLKRATLGTRFEGPLTVPNEPWHYEYAPRVRTAREEE